MICPHCQAPVSETAKFCAECGQSLLSAGNVAPTESRDDARFEPVPLEGGGRRQLTVMFCDVVNSTKLSEEIDPEELRDYLRHYQETCATVIRRFDGYIAKYLGDGLLVHFGYPTAHEDDAQRAVRAGLGMLEALQYSDFKGSHGHTVPFQIRIGIHTGLVVIDQIGAESQRTMDIFGETPNIAARLQSLAEPNALLVSASTHRLIAGYFEQEYLGPQSIKGISTPIGIYRVLHESAARTRLEAAAHAGLTQMIGRVDEIARLKLLWHDAETGHGHTVFISGEAGIGKSRITLAIKESVAKEADTWLVETQCSPYYQNTAFYPIAHLYEQTVLQFTTSDSVEAKYAKLEGYLVQNGFDPQENVPLLLPLLSLPPNARYKPLDILSSRIKQRTMDLLMQLLLRRAAQQPILFIAEDLHWADPSTIELLGHILQQIPSHRLLAVLTFRPEFTPPWSDEIASEHIVLTRLQQHETRALVEQIVRHKRLPKEIADQILSKTDGVPLFIEELTKTIVESGSLVESGDHYDLAGDLENVSVPSTLQDSLMARLDRLPSGKLLAQVCAVLGREFSYPVLQAIFPEPEEKLRQQLEQLVGAELLFQRGATPDATFIFKHALIQDAAYDSLLKTDRQKYHRETAAALKNSFPDIYTSRPELVAHHYTAAKLTAEAIPEWLRAGKQADQRSANQEAGTHYRKGIELLDSLPADSPLRGYELPLQLSYGMSIIMVRGYSVPEVAPAINRARELCAYMGDAPELPMVLWALWAYYVVLGDLHISLKFAQEFLEVAERRGDDSLLVEADSMFTLEYFLAGDPTRATLQMEQCFERYDIATHGQLAYLYTQDPLVVAGSLGVWNEYFLGFPDGARRHSARIVEHARKLGHSFSLNYGIAFTAWLCFFMDMPDETEKFAFEALTLATENGYALWAGDALILLGWVKIRRSGTDRAAITEGFASFEQGLGIFQAIGRGSGLPGILNMKVDFLTKLGRYDEAWETLRQSQKLEADWGQYYERSVSLRREAELIMAEAADKHEDGNAASRRAETLLRESIEDARGRANKCHQLNSIVALYELMKNTTRKSEVLREMKEVFDSYTEGFDVPLLKQVASILT